MRWQWRNRGSNKWEDLPAKPERRHIEMEYRSLNAAGEQTWRSPPHPAYREKP